MEDEPVWTAEPSDDPPAGLTLYPVAGLGEFAAGDALADVLAQAAPWLADDDILVVTSKIVSKVEGRVVPTPQDAAARDARRRELVAQESTRVLARYGRTLITQNKLGLVQAASGVDSSNVATDELALLPDDPDASAAHLRAELQQQLGVTVGVVITDTMGRAWRRGLTDVAIGSAGLPVLRDFTGSRDPHGNELWLTEVALADEIAAAADLVQGKLARVPACVVRGLHWEDDGSRAADLVRPLDEDLFSLGTQEAIELGREQGRAEKHERRDSSGPHS